MTLIVNPAAGRASLLNRQLPAIEDLLRHHGYSVDVLRTTPHAGSAAALARSAASDSTLILACGGDGTVHEVVQGLAGATRVPLGVLPLGTANALAHNLLLPLEPLAAAARLLNYRARAVPLGSIDTIRGQSWFAVMAGCGPDGALVQALPPALKARLGRAAYYGYAARLFLSRRWPVFNVRYRSSGDPAWHTVDAVALLAARVPDLGGAFTGLTHDAPVMGPALNLYVLRPPARIALAAWFAASRVHLPNPWLLRVQAEQVICEGPPEVLAQADAEAMGGLPLRMSIVPDALRLMMPPLGHQADGLRQSRE